jgi:hypothetical protein
LQGEKLVKLLSLTFFTTFTIYFSANSGKGLNSNLSNHNNEVENLGKTVKLKDEVFDRLEKYCGEVKKKSAVASKAVKEYLDRKEENT